MRITVCQLPDDPSLLLDAWRGLRAHAEAAGSELVLLPEMPFHPWVGVAETPDPEVWEAAARAHETWIGRLGELGADAVVATRPVLHGDSRRNRAFAWSEDGIRDLHDKYYLPDEEGYWEASWYERGDDDFEVAEVAGVRVGVQICTEMWFFQRARAYGRDGAQLLLVPRATPRDTHEKWLAGGRAAAVVSGAFCASSNLWEPPGRSPADLGGGGWLIDPDGAVLATTSESTPWISVDVDPVRADDAKAGYPRYVPD